MGMLDGVKVVEAATFITGPLAATALADLGAEVIKVEPAPNGDPFRRFGRLHNDLSIAFANCNREKRSVFLNLKESKGIEELHSLLSDADAFITNWRPGTAARLGLTDEAVGSLHPQLNWVKISGFGPTGPLAAQPAFDAILQARCGIAFTQGLAGDPEYIHSYFVDKVAAMMACQAVLASLVGRDRRGRGLMIDVSMLDAIAYFNFPDTMVERTVINAPGPISVNRQVQAPRPLRTSDGWVAVNPVGGKQLAATISAAGHPEWTDRLKAIADPVKIAETIFSLLESATKHRPTDFWLQAFAAVDVPVAPVLDIDGHLADPQISHNGTYTEINHERLGPIRAPLHPAREVSLSVD
jgi:crotonobetainyl-CoA:carnitine CoA-transferase CaiB-like acyl-CoA transferase